MERTAPADPARPDVAYPARVLVVDDNEDIVRVVQRILLKEGYEISTAFDGEQALAVARREMPDVILLDVMMPKIDGLEISRRLKADPATSGIMIILVTGRGSLDHLVEGLDAGADDYIPKPFHIPELLARTRCALRIRRLTEDLEQRNREIIQSQTQLVQKEKMATIGLLASGIAHEFNNIMAGICGYAQLAERDDRYKETLVKVALTQAQRAFELTSSLSAYNRVGGQSRDADVKQVVRDALCLVTKESQRSGVLVETDVEEGLRARVCAGELQEIVLNLVVNSLHAMSGSNRRLEVRAARQGDSVRLVVRDTGEGISEKALPKIFDPFFTTKGALGGGSQGGTGLGLTVVYNLVQAYGGSIEARSVPGRGTTMEILLPACEARSLDTATSPPRISFEEESTGRLRILVIDDEEMTHEIVRAYLEQHEVVSCLDAESGLEQHARKPFDFVLLDVCLPNGMNGFDAFEKFQELPSPPRIIFASGCFPDAVYRSYLDRAHGHLLKPFKLEDLSTLLSATRPRLVEVAGSLDARA